MAFGSFGIRGISPEQGPYAAWTTRLTAWSTDPTTSLEGLPQLEEQTFDRATYNRFNERLSEALQIFMNRWSEHLSTAFGHANGTHELGVALVQLRNSLKPRVTLSRHAGLPQGIRTALESGLAKDLANIQQQIEDGVRQNTARGSVDHSHTDLLLAVVRENSMMALLTTTDLSDLPWEPPSQRKVPTTTAPTRKIFPPG